MGQDLRDMTTGQVAERARQAGIQNVEKMDKGEMIEALQRKGQGGSERFDTQQGGGQSQKDPAPPGVPPSEYKNIPGNQT
jgi:hypothetical protein